MDMASFAGRRRRGIGGMVAGILGAELRPGIELVMETVELESHVQQADLVITAEGAIDAQSAYGKTPAGVASLARKHGVPVIGLAGKLGDDLDELHKLGLSAAFSITPEPMSLQEAYNRAERIWNRLLSSWPEWCTVCQAGARLLASPVSSILPRASLT